MDRQQVSLQQKQAYFRQHIDQDLYQNFSQYFQLNYKNLNIFSMSMAQIQDIVRKFNKQSQEKALANAKNIVRYSYMDYQSKQNSEVSRDTTQKQQGTNYIEESQISECKSSKIAKSSAMDLLDQFVQPSHSINSIPQNQYGLGVKTNTQPLSSSQTRNHKNNLAVSNDFDFWTSTINTKNQKQNTQARNKSSHEQRQSKNFTNNSPSTPKNVYNFVDYGLTNNNNNSNFSANNNMNININITDHNKGRHSTQQYKPEDFQIFCSGLPPTDSSKKSSPYTKKQGPSQSYEPSSRIGTIKLKQVKDWHQQPRGQSVNTKLKSSQIVQLNFSQIINCYKSTNRQQLSDRNLNIFIDKHEIIQRKFLAADYAMYNMKVYPLNIQCKRNYEDFSKLRSNLAKFFPGIHLPYLQESSWFSGTNEDFIASQKKMLQFFIRDLIRNKQFRNSVIMEDFLTFKDHKQIKRKFEKYQQAQSLKGIQQLCLVQGKVKCTINSQQNAYIDNMQKFIQKMNQLYERQERLTETLIQQYSELMKTFKSLINLMNEMEKQIKQFNEKVKINNIKHLGTAFKLLRETYKQQYANSKFQSQINSKKVLPFLKYQRKNFNQLTNLIQTEKKLKKSFDKRSLTQKIGVGQTYLSQCTKGNRKGVLDESASMIVLKYQVGYVGYQTRQESQRVFDQLTLKIVGKWQSIGSSYLDKLTNSIQYWKNLIKTDQSKFNTQLTF